MRWTHSLGIMEDVLPLEWYDYLCAVVHNVKAMIL